MLSTILRVPISSPAVLIPIDVLAAALVVIVLLDLRSARRLPPLGRRRRLRRLIAMVSATAVGGVFGLALVWWVGDVRNEFGVHLTDVTRMWVAFLFAGVGLFVAAVVQGGHQRRISALGAAGVVALASGLGVNVDFGAYRDLQQALVTNPYPRSGLADQHAAAPGEAVVRAASWRAPAGMPHEGRILQVRIPGKVSHFSAREAVVYLPPAALTADPPTLPVLIGLSGQPGAPADMFQSGDLGADLDAYAARHHGLAPIVVDPDQLGAANRNPMCVDSRSLGHSATYVLTDVAAWIRDHLNVGPAPDAWGVLGFSQGATCSMQFSASDPTLFGTTLAISSELRQFNGSVQQSADIGYGGSVRAYFADSPVEQLIHHAPYLDHLTVFAFGQDDAPYRASTMQLRAAAVQAGMHTELFVSPGSAHDWNTVRYALVHALPSVIAHVGLPR